MTTGLPVRLNDHDVTHDEQTRRAARPANAADAGHAALERGEWQEALAAFESSPETHADPRALEGFGLAAWWLDRADLVFDTRERAYRLYREREEPESAARVAVWLAWDTAAFRGEPAIARGWLQRA